MSFFLVEVQSLGDGKVVETPLADFGPYEKGSEAAKAAKDLGASLGKLVQPRRMSQAPDWRARQRDRIASGELEALPAKWDLPPIEDHFAHLDKTDPTKIAFTEDEKLGVIDRVTATSPGRYLSRFYPDIDDDRRRKLIAAIDPNGDIIFGFKPEDFEYVYLNGPGSCMDSKHEFPKAQVWPTSIYGAGDLAIAYSKNRQGRIQSRAVVWPEKKLFGRVYGDVQRFKSALESEGYTSLWDVAAHSSIGHFHGAKLLKIESETQPGWFIAPYFDNIRNAVDRGDHFVAVEKVEPGDIYIGGSTQGVCQLYRICPKAGGSRLLSDFAFVNGVNEQWSDAAIRQYAFTCRGSGEIWPVENRITLGNGDLWSEKYFSEHGARCELSGTAWPKDEIVSFKGRRVHISETRKDILPVRTEMPWDLSIATRDPFITFDTAA